MAALLATMFAAAFLLSCGGDSQSTQDGSASVSTKDSSTSRTSRTGTSTNSKTGTSTSGDSAKRHSSVPTAEEIQEDLIGESITDPELGKWTFEDESEFLEFTIEDEDVSDSRTTFIVGMKLKDIGDGRIYNGQAKVIYKKDGRFWAFSSVTGEYRSGGPSI
ncbi:MAG: hypothetical protein HZB44_04890 [Actinobacteria bacterium]|nr:hypothetical protein [Actinomycetota bacterium]